MNDTGMKADNGSKKYGRLVSYSDEFWFVDDEYCVFKKGKILRIIGSYVSGKSMLLNMLT